MGLGMGLSRCSGSGCGSCGTAKPLPNPNPTNFKINRSYSVGRAVMIDITYPDCTNYEGRKFLVFLNISAAEIKQLAFIDPHFCESSAHQVPVARFEPTDRGWSFGKSFCNTIATTT